MAQPGRKRPRAPARTESHHGPRLTALASEDQVAALYSVRFCPHGDAFRDYAAVTGGRKVSVYEAPPSGGLRPVLSFMDDDTEEDYYALAWLLHWRAPHVLLAVAGERGSINVLNCHTHKRCRLLPGHGNSVNALCPHPLRPSMLFSCSKDESIRLWNVRTATCVAIFTGHAGHRDEVLSIDVHLSGDRFASSGMDNTVRVWSLQEPSVVAAIEESECWSEPEEVDVDPGRGMPQGAAPAASAASSSSSSSSAAVVRRVEERKQERAPFHTRLSQLPVFTTRRVHSDYVDAVLWLGDALVSKSTEGRVVVWKPDLRYARDGVCVLQTFTLPESSIWFVRHALSEDLSRLACGNREGTVHVWDTRGRESKPAYVLKPAQCKVPVRHAAFNRDNDILLAVSDDGCIWRWDFVRPGSAAASGQQAEGEEGADAAASAAASAGAAKGKGARAKAAPPASS